MSRLVMVVATFMLASFLLHTVAIGQYNDENLENVGPISMKKRYFLSLNQLTVILRRQRMKGKRLRHWLTAD